MKPHPTLVGILASTMLYAALPEARAFAAISANPVAQFKITYDAAISGWNDQHLTDVTPSDCALACLDSSWCKSFDYYKATHQCDLSTRNTQTAGGLKTDYAGDPYDHYDLDRLQPFSLHPSAAIQGHNVEHLTSVTREDCAAACLDRAFCESFDYYKFTSECDLSDERAVDVGGLKTDYPGDPFDHYSLALPDFDRTRDACIIGNDVEAVLSASPSDCAAACLDRAWCRSFDYLRDNNRCALSDKTAEDVGGLSTLCPGAMDHYAVSSVHLAKQFAPRLRFDVGATNYPMSAQTFYDDAVVTPQSSGDRDQNTSFSTISANMVPTYYQVIGCGDQVRIKYWWFYGYQGTCDGVSGAHNGDWESVLVTLSEDRRSVAAVTFWAHGMFYTRIAARNGFGLTGGTHPIVYVGKASHASYFNQGGSGSCLYWEDFRNSNSSAFMDAKNNLVNLDQDSEPWMVEDRVGGFDWGHDGVGTHPTKKGPSCSMDACDWAAGKEAQWHTHCKAGDTDTGVECMERCKSGYDDTGLLCSRCTGSWDPTTWSCNTYSKRRYGYDYTLPTSDDGLL